MSKTSTKEHPIRGKVVPSLITAAIISLVTTLIPGGWKWVFSKCHTAWLWFISSVTIPSWLLILLSVLSLALLVALAVLVYAVTRKEENNPVLYYTEDIIFGIRWRWHYGENSIYDLCAFCPHCDLQVNTLPRSRSSPLAVLAYYCNDCQRELECFEFGQLEVENRVKRKVQQKLRKLMSEKEAA